MIIALSIAVVVLGIWVNKLSKRPYIEITEQGDELVLVSGGKELKRFIKIEKK